MFGSFFASLCYSTKDPNQCYNQNSTFFFFFLYTRGIGLLFFILLKGLITNGDLFSYSHCSLEKIFLHTLFSLVIHHSSWVPYLYRWNFLRQVFHILFISVHLVWFIQMHDYKWAEGIERGSSRIRVGQNISLIRLS